MEFCGKVPKLWNCNETCDTELLESRKIALYGQTAKQQIKNHDDYNDDDDDFVDDVDDVYMHYHITYISTYSLRAIVFVLIRSHFFDWIHC